MDVKYNKKIYYHDTDCGQVVYYANYLKYFEEARTEYLRQAGVILEELAKREIVFVVREVNVKYKLPAHYADNLEITSGIGKVKSASLIFYQQALRENLLLVNAETTLVCVDIAFTPIPIPKDLLKCLKGLSQNP